MERFENCANMDSLKYGGLIFYSSVSHLHCIYNGLCSDFCFIKIVEIFSALQTEEEARCKEEVRRRSMINWKKQYLLSKSNWLLQLLVIEDSL